MNEPLAWVNHRIVPFSQAAVSVSDLGVVAGAAVSELGRTFHHHPFRLDQHLQRFLESCESLEVPLDVTAETLAAVVLQLVSTNVSLISQSQDLGFVLFATAGPNLTYGSADSDTGGTVCVHTFPLPLWRWRDAIRNGVRLRIPRVRQIPVECLPIHHKIRNRMHWWLADREATRIEPGSRALLADLSGCLTETSSAAFFVVREGVVETPDTGVLNSLSGRLIEELCGLEGIPFRRCRIPVERLESCSEAFLTSSASCVLPVQAIDDHQVGRQIPGPVTVRLQNAWSKLAGVDILDQIRSSTD